MPGVVEDREYTFIEDIAGRAIVRKYKVNKIQEEKIMNEYLEKIVEVKKQRMVEAYKKHHMELIFMENAEQLREYLKGILHSGKSVCVGGSQTLFETGVIDQIRNSDVVFYDRYEEGLTPDQIQEVFRKGFFSDIYFTSTNALTVDGCLYNIDYTGNRVASMIYGPKEVYVIAGKNKVFDSEASAIEHVKNVACPANCARYHRNTPCVKLGKCMDCASEEKLCSSYVKMGFQKELNRIKVIVLNEEYGF